MPKKSKRIDISILKAIAAVRGDAAMSEQVITPDLFSISAAVQKTADEAENNPEPGHLMRDGTIYLGRYIPKDREDNPLGKIFNVFAAPKNLPKTMNYLNTVKYIARLKRWNGFPGTHYPTDQEIYTALKDGSYNGGWLIPPLDLLLTNALDDESVAKQGDSLFAYQDKGAFKGTITATRSGANFSKWYLSSTEMKGSPSYVWAVRLSDGERGPYLKGYLHLGCRPVRLVEVKPTSSGMR